MNDTKLPIYFAYARSGGTLLNRCLASISENFVLSEVNPHASVTPIEIQARDWLRLVSQENYFEFANQNYVGKIQYLVEKIRENNNFLIVRDWVTLNFLPGVIPPYTPSMILESSLYFERHGMEINPIVFVRRSAEVYESITRTFNRFKKLSVQEFGYFYLAYAKAVCSYPIFHYDQFCQNPESELKRICTTLGVNYDDNFLKSFFNFNYCTGDSNPDLNSRGYALKNIKTMPTHNNSEQYIAASLDVNCQKADQILGFPEIKTEEKFENIWKLVQSRNLALKQTKTKFDKVCFELEQTQINQEKSQQLLEQTQTELESSQQQLQQTQINQEKSQLVLLQTQTELNNSQQQLKQTQIELENSQLQLQQVQLEVCAMKSSKFWQLRRLWFKCKRLLITDAK